MKATLVLAAVLASPACAANPIRKVVTMLQHMQKKVEADGEAEQELFDKFMCYCKNGAAALEKSIADAEAASPELSANIEEARGKLVQLKEDLKKTKADREAVKVAMAEATGIREQDAAAYEPEAVKLKGYLADLDKAITALKGGAVGAFLQTSAADTLRKLVEDSDSMSDIDREDMTTFLTGSPASFLQLRQEPEAAPAEAEAAPAAEAEAAPAADAAEAAPAADANAAAPATDATAPAESAGGGLGMAAIAGILQQMADRMTTTLGELTGKEEASIKSYDELMAAKSAEVQALTSQIEEKPARIGELGLEIVQMKADLGDTAGSLEDDKKFAADLKKNCATKEAEWAGVCKTRSEEIVALADTIKILNDDDALEMFKKTLPGASSFLQIQVSESALRTRALSVLQDAKVGKKADRHRLDFVMLALRGKKIGLGKVMKMIDNMVALLHEEASDDEAQKEFCQKEFDVADDKKKALTRSEGKLETSVDDAKESVGALKEKIAALEEGIVALDKSVAEATDQRREENSDYKTLMISNNAAKELLVFAKNRMNKFYNPKLYKAPQRALTEEERITLNMGGTLAPTAAPMFMQISAHRGKADPGPPPAGPGAHKKQDGNGVIAMIDLLTKDLDTEMSEAEVNEKNAQEEYEEMIADSASKRAKDGKSMADKSAAQAEAQSTILSESEELTNTKKEIMATHEYIGQLHGQCDWMLKFFDVRVQARNAEAGALKKAKAVLSGADFSLLQTSARKFLHK